MMMETYPADWYADPSGEFEHRYWNGQRWTEHVGRNGQRSTDAGWPRSTQPVQAETSLAADVGQVALSIGADLLVWLVPVVVLGGIGVLLMAAGTTETTNAIGTTSTELSGTGIVGGGFFLFAIAAFFGRGSFKALMATIKGQGGFTDIFFVQSNLISALIAAGATLLGVIVVFLGLTRG